jgi:hypothetical protein
MKFKTITGLASILALSLQYATPAASQSDSGISALGRALTPAVVTPSRVVSAQARKIAAALDQRLLALANVICHEQIARYARRGMEKYTGIRRKQKIFPDMQKLPGTWSVGEMATLLSETREAIQLGDVQIGQDESADLGRTSILTFSNPASARRWYLKANSQTHWLPFEGRVWTSPETGEIQRISWFANDLPTESGVAQVLWTVDFSPVDLTNLVVTLPQKALYQITYRNGWDHLDWNVTNFSEYRRYGADTTIHFDQ